MGSLLDKRRKQRANKKMKDSQRKREREITPYVRREKREEKVGADGDKVCTIEIVNRGG